MRTQVFRNGIALFACLSVVSLITLAQDTDRDGCPALAASTWNPDGLDRFYFGYPTDIYKNAPNTTGYEHNSRVYKCGSSEKNSNIALHSCYSTNSICPVAAQNLIDAVVIDDKRPCLRNEEDVIQIVIIGGSVTLGANAGGCCCSEDIDPQCKGINKDCSVHSSPKTDMVDCSWASHFQRFLYQFGDKYKLINLAVHGSTSTYMATQIRHILHAKGIKLSSTDIVIIDHSVEPLTTFSKSEIYHTVSGTEYLVRQILHSHNHSITCPSIVLLETNPMHFSIQYHAISIRYGLNMWSIKSIAISQYAKENQMSMRPYLMFEKNFMYARQKPPWHVHLYYADIISNLFLEKFHKNCQKGTTAQSCVLTYPLTDKSLLACNHSIPSFVFGDYRDAVTPSIRFERSIKRSWQHKEFAPGYYYLISQLEGGSTDLQSLAFDIPPEALLLPGDQELVFHYTFRRSFFNAGALQINLCDRWIAVADSLWEDYATNHLTISIRKSVSFTVNDIRNYCKTTPPFIILEHYRHVGKTREEDKARTMGQTFCLESLELCVANEKLL